MITHTLSDILRDIPDSEELQLCKSGDSYQAVITSGQDDGYYGYGETPYLAARSAFNTYDQDRFKPPGKVPSF